VFIESKVIAKLGAEQINRHRRTAMRRGFDAITAVAIAPNLSCTLPPATVPLKWQDVYTWLCRHASNSEWAKRAAEYLEIAEARLIDAEWPSEAAATIARGRI
jgi:hypothetical protein